MKDNLTKEFLHALQEIETILFAMLFKKQSLLEKGLAYYVYYKRGSTIVEYIFGPPEFHIEIIIETSKGKYEFKDLLAIPEIADWVSKNRYKQKGERNVKDEMLWSIELLKYSLPLIE